MRLIVAGASGFVGKELVPLLSTKVDELLLVGRSAEKLRLVFPDYNCVDYDGLPGVINGYDTMVCLVTRNSDQSGTLEQFRHVNVEVVTELAEMAAQSKLQLFIHFSTFHAVSLGALNSHYAITKLEAERSIRSVEGIKVVNIRLPAIYGQSLSGNLKILSIFPNVVRKNVLSWIGAIKPVVAVELIATKLSDLRFPAVARTIYLSDRPSQLYFVLKRTTDLAGALVVVALLGWLFPLIWIGIKLDSKGPGVFTQQRIGREKEPFNCYKFRTMFTDTEQGATHQMKASSVTRIGRILRATKLDELPQIMNIFQNTMSLVGPRPCLPQQKELIKFRDRRDVFSVKPGITGLAQIRSVDMSRPDELAEIDSDYIHTRSFLMDLKILLATMSGRGSGDRVSADKNTD